MFKCPLLTLRNTRNNWLLKLRRLKLHDSHTKRKRKVAKKGKGKAAAEDKSAEGDNNKVAEEPAKKATAE